MGFRFVVVGAGAIGGVVGARLFQAGYETLLVARGANFEAIRRHGLRIEAPSGSQQVPLAVIDDPGRIDWGPHDVVLLAVKSQDTVGALRSLSSAPASVPVVCIQNGVANETAVLREFHQVYAGRIRCPASHLEPGTVHAHSEPVTGLLDLGMFPTGLDAIAARLVEAFTRASFDARAVPDVIRLKYAKLITNLQNIVVALCVPGHDADLLIEAARREGEGILRAASIRYEPDPDDGSRWASVAVEPTSVEYAGSSTTQSLVRAKPSLETAYLNGEIVLLGKLHGVPTPINSTLMSYAKVAAGGGIKIKSLPAHVIMDHAADLVRCPDATHVQA